MFYDVRLSIMLNLHNLFFNFFFQYVSFFFGSLLPENIPTISNQEVLSRVMVDGRRVYITRSSKKFWIITMDSLVTWHVGPYCRK